MLLGGDEIGRTQQGNNNPYNQDNATSWYDWNLDEDRRRLLEFTSRLIDLRSRHPNLRRRAFLDGRIHAAGERLPLRWLREDGQEMTDGEWHTPWYRCFALLLDGEIDDLDADGGRLHDDALLIILNASELPVAFLLPQRTRKASTPVRRTRSPHALSRCCAQWRLLRSRPREIADTPTIAYNVLQPLTLVRRGQLEGR